MSGIILTVFLMVMALLTGGCANYASDYDQYSTAYGVHEVQKAEQMRAMADVALRGMENMTDPTAKALYAVMMGQSMQQVSASQFQLVKPTTWTDFWQGIWPTLQNAAPFIGVGYVVNQMAKTTGGNMTLNADTINADKSFNRMESHVTGNSNQATIPNFQETTTTTNGEGMMGSIPK